MKLLMKSSSELKMVTRGDDGGTGTGTGRFFSVTTILAPGGLGISISISGNSEVAAGVA